MSPTKVVKKPRGASLRIPLDLSGLDNDKYASNPLMVARCMNRLQRAENSEEMIVKHVHGIAEDDWRDNHSDSRNYGEDQENVWGFQDGDLESLDGLCPSVDQFALRVLERLWGLITMFILMMVQIIQAVATTSVSIKARNVDVSHFQRRLALPLIPGLILAVSVVFVCL